VNKPKRREHNLIYAAANLNREYNYHNGRLRSTFCIIEADRHEASRGLFATGELLVVKMDMKVYDVRTNEFFFYKYA